MFLLCKSTSSTIVVFHHKRTKKCAFRLPRKLPRSSTLAGFVIAVFHFRGWIQSWKNRSSFRKKRKSSLSGKSPMSMASFFTLFQAIHSHVSTKIFIGLASKVIVNVHCSLQMNIINGPGHGQRTPQLNFPITKLVVVVWKNLDCASRERWSMIRPFIWGVSGGWPTICSANKCE